MLIEIGPHSSLKTPIHEILKDNKIWGPSIKYIPSLSRGQDANIDVLRLASALFATGYDVDIPAINSIHAAQEGEGHLLCDVPSYSWTHLNTLWYESRLSKNHRCRKFPRIDLLGVLVDDFKDMDLRWRGVLRVSGLPWLSQHKIQGNTVFPMAAFLAMIIEAAHQRAILRSVTMTNSSKYVLKEISVKRPLLLPDSAEIETSLTLKAHREGSRNSSTSWDEFFIYSWTAEAGWSEHCQGLIMVVETPKIANPIDGQRFAQGREAAIRDSIEQQEKLCSTSLDCTKTYSNLSRVGLEYGQSSKTLLAHVHVLAIVLQLSRLQTPPRSCQTILRATSRYTRHSWTPVFIPSSWLGRVAS